MTPAPKELNVVPVLVPAQEVGHAADAHGEAEVLGHDGHALGVEGAQAAARARA